MKMHNKTTNLGAAIKAARKRKHLTQMALSEELGITPRHLQALENESKTPSYALLSRVLSYLDIPADSIFSAGEEAMPETLSKEKEQLLYLIKSNCYERDILVLLSTAISLVNKKEQPPSL